MAVLDEFASLDFFRIRNLTAFFIGICKRVQNRAPPPPGRLGRGGPEGGSPPPSLERGAGGGGAGGAGAGGAGLGSGGGSLRGRTMARGGGGGAGGAGGRSSRSPGSAAGMRRASPPLHFMLDTAGDSPPPRRWVSKSPPPRR